MRAGCESSCGPAEGTEESGAGEFGASVALAADGNTALIGAFADNGYKGAAWIFTAASLSTPAELAFGSQAVSEPGAISWLPVTNKGSEAVTVTGAQISGPDAADFSIPTGDDLCADQELQVHETCQIGVRFTRKQPAKARHPDPRALRRH